MIKCRVCIFWEPITKPAMAETFEDKIQAIDSLFKGSCHRYPPTTDTNKFPITTLYDYCQEGQTK